MKNCGYDKKFRSEVLKSAKSAYEKIIEKHKKENTPLYKNRHELDKIKSLKHQSPQNWWQKTAKSAKPYTNVLFVPPTPQGGLAKALRKRERELNSKNEMNIRIIEKGGIKVKSILTKSDPFYRTKCDVQDCPFCSPTPLLMLNKEQNCRSHNEFNAPSISGHHLMRIQIESKHILLPELLNKFVISKVFADVTLASDDGITLRAQKISPCLYLNLYQNRMPSQVRIQPSVLQCCNNENKG